MEDEEGQDEGAKAFKPKKPHAPSLIQQIQKEAQKVQTDALKGIGSLKNKVNILLQIFFLGLDANTVQHQVAWTIL